MNFALTDWVSFGRLAVETYRFSRSAVFSHHEYIVKAALDLVHDVYNKDHQSKHNNENKCPNILNEKESNNSKDHSIPLTPQPYDYNEFFET